MGRFQDKINQTNCIDCKYEVCQMLFVLIMMIICPEVTATEEKSNGQNATIIDNSLAEVGYREHLGRFKHSKANTSPQQTKSLQLELFKNESVAQSPIELVLKTNSYANYASLQARLGKHSYNVSLSSTNANGSTAQPMPFPSSALSKTTTAATGNFNNTIDDELNTSDSRLIPQMVSSGSDEEVEPATNEEDSAPDSDDNVEVWADGASSTLSEKKAVKELTKLLSKGMSGATNQVRLETLENWKRRQKERKLAKESRAKLFEDLLTTAINTHPEKIKNKSTSSGGSGTNRIQRNKEDPQKGLYSSASTGLINAPGVDPESADDAETVLSHLQNLASIIDHRPTPIMAGEESVMPSDDVQPPSDENANDSAESGSSNNSSEETDESDGKSALTSSSKKKPPSSDRPIVRQFKKIKQQISNRRKQLDQIKKLFNVELALNPKDGGLVGKSLSSNGKKKEQGSTSSYDDGGNEEGVSKRKASSKSAKMRELMGYLRDNPEILASVMSELTVDSDPTRPSIVSGSEDAGSPTQSMDEQVVEMGSASNRKSIKRQNDFGAWERRRSISKLLDSAHIDESRLLALLSSKRSSSRSGEDIRIVRPPPSIVITQAQAASARPKSTEALLLESLRERQLMNLARLDLVLAEKHQQPSHQITANRTVHPQYHHVVSPLNSSSLVEEPVYQKGETEIPEAFEQRQPISSQDSSNNVNTSASEEEVPQHQQYETQAVQDHQYEAAHLSVSNNARSSSHQPYQSPKLVYEQQSNQSEQQHIQPTQQRQYFPEKQRSYLPEQSRTYPPEQQQQHSYLPDQQRSSYLSERRLHQYHHHQQQQQHQDQEQQYAAQSTHSNAGVNKQNSLNRFTNWRDVSKSEASSSLQRSGKANPPSNITWAAYDLNTGSSSANVEAHRSAAALLSGKTIHQQSLETYGSQNNTSTSHALGGNQQDKQVINYPDSTVFRHASQFQPIYQAASNSFQGSIKPVASMSMTDSVIAENELNTAQLPSLVNLEQRPQAHQNEVGGFEQPPAEAVGRPNAPVDYFSAYKNEIVGEGQTARQISKMVQGPETLSPSKRSQDQMGAMWAAK